MKIFYAGSLLLIAFGIVWAASVPFAFECDRSSGFIMDPNAHQRVGYVTQLDSNGSTLPKDLQINVPFKPTHLQVSLGANGLSTAKVVGVIENFTWNGGVGDPLKIDFYVSQQNAMALKALQSRNLTNAKIDNFSWLICNYDQEAKTWYEQSYPQSSPTITGIIGPKSNPVLSVDMTGVPAKDGINVTVYKASIQIAPPANKAYALSFANSAAKPTTKNWGLVVGSLAPQAIATPK